MSSEYIPHPDEYQPDDQLAWEWDQQTPDDVIANAEGDAMLLASWEEAQRADDAEIDHDPDGYTDEELEEMEREYLARYPEPPF